MISFQSEGEPVHLHTFREFPSFPGQLPLPTTFERNAGTGAGRRRQPGFRAICKGGRSAARRVSSSGKAAPHARASEDRAGRASPAAPEGAERPGGAAGLRGPPGGNPSSPLEESKPGRRLARGSPDPENRLRRQRQAQNGQGAVDRDPRRRASGWGESPRRPQTPAGLRMPPTPRTGASLRCAGMTGRPRPPRPLDPVTPPSPPHRSWTGRKVLESLGGRQVFAGRLPWCT